MSPLHPVDPTTAWFLAAPAIRALSELPGLSADEKHARASRAWAAILYLGPMDAYRTMLASQAMVLNEMLGLAARDVLIESRRGVMSGGESPMTTRAMNSYVGLHRALAQNVNTFARLTKEAEPAPERPASRRKPAATAAEPVGEAAEPVGKAAERVGEAAEPVVTGTEASWRDRLEPVVTGTELKARPRNRSAGPRDLLFKRGNGSARPRTAIPAPQRKTPRLSRRTSRRTGP